MFKQATRQQSKLRMTLDGPAGSGKTYTALRFAHELQRMSGGKIALIDTERGSASKYVGEHPDGYPWEFDVLELTNFSPERYTEGILAAGRAGYGVLVIDSLSHAWEGVGGALDMKMKAGDAWRDWRHVTPVHNRMVDAILQSPCHVITSMRSRMEYVQDTDDKGRITIRKVGLAPVQRPGMEFEFDLVCDIDWAHILTVSKSRCSAVVDMVIDKPGPEFMRLVIDWLQSGTKEEKPVEFTQAKPTSAPEQQPETPAPAEESTSAFTLEELLDLFGPERVLAANGGKFPESEEDLNGIALALSGGAA